MTFFREMEFWFRGMSLWWYSEEADQDFIWFLEILDMFLEVIGSKQYLSMTRA